MAEFKFSCPKCAQHILCDTDYAGEQINCPTCNELIVVPQPPRSAAPPPPPARPSTLSTQRPTSVPVMPSTGMRAAVKPPAQKTSSGAMKKILAISAMIVVLAALGVGGWFGYSKYKKVQAKKGNPAAQVATPTSAATVQAFSILNKVHSAYTNLTSVREDETISLFLDVSNITMADVNPNLSPDAKNANRHPQGWPRIISNTTDISVKRAQTNLYYVAGDAVSKIDRKNTTNTFAIWSSGKGQFVFSDSHQKGSSPTYMQFAAANTANAAPEQIKRVQEIFTDPANLTKLIKNLGQTDDESVNGQDCYTLTAKVLGQKVKIWVDKTSYLVSQWEITLGGAVSDADIDDVFSLITTVVTNVPPAELNSAKDQMKKVSPVLTKIRGTITATVKDIEMNPTLSADDFDYAVPAGVRLMRMPGATNTRATSLQDQQRNACINNLRQIDAAKNEFALEKGKANGTVVTESDITPYIAGGKMPVCPSGGTYTIGKVGEKPTCSTAGHFLP